MFKFNRPRPVESQSTLKKGRQNFYFTTENSLEILHEIKKAQQDNMKDFEDDFPQNDPNNLFYALLFAIFTIVSVVLFLSLLSQLK